MAVSSMVASLCHVSVQRGGAQCSCATDQMLNDGNWEDHMSGVVCGCQKSVPKS